MNNIVFSDEMSAAEYNELRRLVGFNPLTQGQAERGLEHTTFLTVARDGDKIIAMGRVLFDFGYTAYIGDVIVHPEYQRRRLGTRIVKNLIEKTMNAACEGDKIMFILVAAKGKEKFYESFGFESRPNDFLGCGMSMNIVK